MENLNSLFYSFNNFFFESNHHNKKWVIADIHGCYYTLKNLIENKLQPSKKDIIYFLGDYIDRGLGSKQVIDYIQQLTEQGYQVVALKGNHEDVILRCYHQAKQKRNPIAFSSLEDSWLNYGGKETLKSFELNSIKDIPKKYIDYLESLPYYHKEKDFVLVHAGLDFSDEDPFSNKLAMLWAKNYSVDRSKIENKSILHGHVPETLSTIQKKIEGKAVAISLDNGCIYTQKKGKGNLIALELNSLSLTVQANVEEVTHRKVQHAKTRYASF